MKRLLLFPVLTFCGLGYGDAVAAITPGQAAKLPPPASHKIDFAREVKPIFEASCVKCHGRGKAKGGFSLQDRETLLKGGDSGQAIIPGKSAESHLIELVAGLDPDNVMPQKGSKLKPEQIGVLRAWIDQGAPWNPEVSFARPPTPNLVPRKPELPPVRRGVTHPIDRILQPYFESHTIRPSKVASDRVYARRVYLDVIGLLPTPEELAEFESDKRPDKRSRLVARLLGDDRRYTEHWLTFWNDALRNDYRGTGYIDGGRRQITDWLYAALAKNMRFDQFVRELINPTPESEGFARGIVWRGVVNASQTPQMQAAQNISQVFMGVNLKCASCHDSFINDWTLADAYGLAGIYADEPLEMVQCDKPLGQVAKMKFLYPELGDIDPTAPRSDRLEQLARIITQEKDGRLTRTMVNRLWAKFMGRGLVEPVDEMDNVPWNQDLLDWLAADFAENGYDLRKLMERILTSRAYQLPAVAATEQTAKDFVFRGPVVRRMSAEQYLDALATVTGVWKSSPAAQIDFSVADPGLARPEVPTKWIWKDAQAPEKTEATAIYLRKTIHLPESPTEATAIVTCDNSFRLFVNGKEAGSGNDHTRPKSINLMPHLVKGENILAVEATNGAGKPDDKAADQSNPAGFLFYARVRARESAVEATRRNQPEASVKVMDFASDGSWAWAAEKHEGWQKPDFAAANWEPAVELGDIGMAPWHLEKQFATALSSSALGRQVRAALANNDPLMTALGRPNREQVITTRPSAATTLQALELTNGRTLAELLRRGAEQIAQHVPETTRELIVDLYRRALARTPTKDELRLAEDLVGSPVKKEGVEDLLWAMTMLPEFQLIY